MGKKKYLLFFLVLCTIGSFCLTGCLKGYISELFKEKEESRVVPAEEPPREQYEQKKLEIPEGMLSQLLYFPEVKGNYLVPVSVLIPWTEGVARAALQKLIEGPTPAQEMRFGLTPILSPTTKILGITIRDGAAILDLNNSFLDYDPGKERLVLDSIIFTFLQFSAVKEVEILLEGSKLERFPGGTSAKSFTFDRRPGPNLEVRDEAANFENTAPVKLYFCTLLGQDHIFYIPVTRIVAGQHEIIDSTINELLKGPRQGSGLFSEIPPGTKLKSFSIDEGILRVDFSEEMLYYKGGLSGEENIVQQLVLTLTEIPGVKKVQILIEGERRKLSCGTSLLEPRPRPLLINFLN